MYYYILFLDKFMYVYFSFSASFKNIKGRYYNLPLKLDLVKSNFNFFSLLQPTDKIKLTFSKYGSIGAMSIISQI